MILNLTINNESHAVNLPEGDVPLVFVLRDWLGLTGTKYSCLQGVCGACTVHVNGEPVRACQMAAQDLDGASVTTIEGLSNGGTHPVQKAWIEEQVGQCGWCQSGQIMQAAALISQAPDLSAEDIALGMSNNVCRCGTGPRILKAVARAAEIHRDDTHD